MWAGIGGWIGAGGPAPPSFSPPSRPPPPLTLVLVLDLELVQQVVRRLAHDHGGEELPAKPRAAAGRDALLDDRHLDLRVLGQLVRAREAGRPRADDDHVALGVVVEVFEVARRHRARHGRLFDRRKLEVVKRGRGRAGLDDGAAGGLGAGRGGAENGGKRGGSTGAGGRGRRGWRPRRRAQPPALARRPHAPHPAPRSRPQCARGRRAGWGGAGRRARPQVRDLSAAAAPGMPPPPRPPRPSPPAAATPFATTPPTTSDGTGPGSA